MVFVADGSDGSIRQIGLIGLIKEGFLPRLGNRSVIDNVGTIVSHGRGGMRRTGRMWRPSGAIPSCCHTPGCGALRAPQPGVMHGSALRAELGRSGILLPRSGRSAESATHTSPGQAAPKARAALGGAPYWSVFLGLFGPSRRS